MKILVVAEEYPWPANDGYRQRLDHMVRGLARAGEVDLSGLCPSGTECADPPDIENLGRVTSSPRVVRPGREWLREWSTSSLPRRVLDFDWTEPIRSLEQWDLKPDLVWYSHVHTWVPTHHLFPDTPSIVDFDNLENLATALRRRQPPLLTPGAGPAVRAGEVAKWMKVQALDTVDQRRWTNTQRRCSQAVDRVVVCSSLDVGRAGVDNVVAVPNGAEVPESVRSDRRPLAGDSPTLLFVGALDYEPNADAVSWFVRDVFPLVRTRRPEAIVRVVGRGASRLSWLEGVPGVELVGEVPSVPPELDRADATVVPIRLGAGTRLKVVEALANRVPMVTTRKGCEGIDLVAGKHALISDDPRGFADACLRVLSDGTLRQSLSDAGAELFAEHYTWDAIEQQVADLARSTVADHSRKRPRQDSNLRRTV